MERTATDVASPPIKGGELPSFDELLAKGSFHARLARARMEREKALARSEADADDEFILNTGRKPWEKETRLPLKRDRLSQALDQSVALKDPVVRPLRPPVPTAPEPVAPVAVKAAITELPPLLPAESLVPVPAKRRSKRMHVAAGFGAGVVLGAAAAVLGPLLGTFGTAPVTIAAGPVALAPAVGAAEPVIASLSTVVEPLPAPRLETPLSLAGVVARPAVPTPADAAPQRAGAGPARASAPSALLMVPATLTVQPLPPSPAQVDAVMTHGLPLAPAVVSVAADPAPSVVVLPARPRIPAGPAGLAALPMPDSASIGVAAASGWLAPESGHLISPDATGEVSLEAQPLPVAYSQPDARAVVAPPSRPLFPGRVILNAPASVSDTALADAVGRLNAKGVAPGDPNRVGFTVSESNVRYFHAGDAEAAAAIAEALDARARDFTSFDPAPPQGTIEVWLAGRGEGTSATTPTRKSTKRKQTTVDARLQNLRNRILKQLRNGDHL